MEEDMKTRKQRLVGQLLAGAMACVSATAGSAPVISELFYDAVGSDAGLAFVELFGAPGESLDGLVIEGINGGDGSVYRSIPLTGVIPGDGIFVIGDEVTGTTMVDGADLIADVDFQNGPDSVILRNDVAVLDAVGYGVFALSDVFRGEGTPAPDPVAGSSIARLNPLLDSNDNGVDFAVLDVPTPGSVAGVSAVPLPASVFLFASGLVPLLAARRSSQRR